MALTMDELRTLVRSNIKRTSSAVTPATLLIYLNWAQEWISHHHTFEEMKKTYEANTVADQRLYSFPDRMKDISSLNVQDDSNSVPLVYKHSRQFDIDHPYPEDDTTDMPTEYVDYGTYFELWAIPDAVYVMRMRCSVFPPALSATSSTSDLVRKDPLIVARASVYGFRELREYEQADYWLKVVCAEELTAAINADHSAEDWMPIARGFSVQPGGVLSETNPWRGRR